MLIALFTVSGSVSSPVTDVFTSIPMFNNFLNKYPLGSIIACKKLPVLALPSSSTFSGMFKPTNEFIASVNGANGVVSISFVVVLYVSPVLFVTELELSTLLLLVELPPNMLLNADPILPNIDCFLFFSTVVYDITLPFWSTWGIISEFLGNFVNAKSFEVSPSTSVISSIILVV